MSPVRRIHFPNLDDAVGGRSGVEFRRDRVTGRPPSRPFTDPRRAQKIIWSPSNDAYRATNIVTSPAVNERNAAKNPKSVPRNAGIHRICFPNAWRIVKDPPAQSKIGVRATSVHVAMVPGVIPIIRTITGPSLFEVIDWKVHLVGAVTSRPLEGHRPCPDQVMVRIRFHFSSLRSSKHPTTRHSRGGIGQNCPPRRVDGGHHDRVTGECVGLATLESLR